MTLLMNACAFLVKVLTLPLYIADLFGLLSFYKRVFPRFVYNFTLAYNETMKDKKNELFRNLEKFYPPKGSLRILEVGCGTGANFEHYPTGCRITCTDPNPHFQKYLDTTMAKNDHLVYDSFIVASGENLMAVEDNSVDVVGGALFFIEHVVSDPSTWSYFFQHVVQPFWYYVNDGCDATRTTWKDLEAAGFSDLQISHIQAPMFFMIKPHIIGYAVK